MSNLVVLRQMTFKDKKGNTSHGFIFADNYGECYVDYLEKDENRTDLELLKIVVSLKDEYDQIKDILDFCTSESRGIDINDTYYEYEEIKGVIDV